MRRTLLAVILMVGLGWSGAAAAASCVDAHAAAQATGHFERAVEPCRRDAEHGDMNAQYVLGQMHYFGGAVPRNYAESVNWFRKAADQGHMWAQYSLGIMYRLGNGVPRDPVKAHALFNIAAAQAAALMNERSRELAAEMSPADIARAQEMARDCVEKDYKGCGF